MNMCLTRRQGTLLHTNKRPEIM